MYSINNIAFSAFGISSGRINNSNISFAGMLDMPPRIGKVFHNWTDEAGVEPYVAAGDIRHGGRTLEFSGYMTGGDKANVYGMPETFYRELSGYSDLVPLVTPWSSHQVYIRQDISTEYIGEGWLKIRCRFEEPVVPNAAALPAGTETVKPHIDGVALSSLGIFLKQVNGHLNRPKIKDENFTAYSYQGYQVTPTEALEFELELFAMADSYQALEQNLLGLQKLLAAPGMRRIKVDKVEREVFNIKGFAVNELKVSPQFVIGTIKLPLMTSKPGKPIQLMNMTDGNYNKIVSNLNKLIKLNSWAN